MFKNNYEIAARFTTVEYESITGALPTDQYTIGVNKFIVGHKLKVQTDINYRQRYTYGSTALNSGATDQLYYRLQVDIHF